MAVTYLPVQPNHGLDISVSPPWQMVPVGGQRTLIAVGAGSMVPRIRIPAGKSTRLAAVKSTVAGFTRLSLTGIVAGPAFVEWVPSASFSGPVQNSDILEVSVKAVKEIRTAFHYINDGRRQITNRRARDLPAMIAAANAILTPQANVKLIKKSAAILRIPENLGDIVRYSRHLEGAPDNVDPAQHEWGIVTGHADATADFNVFFVKAYEQDNTPYVNNTRAGTIASEKNCILEDNITSASETLAHETVHLLGIEAHSGTTSHLIASGAVRTGQVISRDEANIINASGT